MLRAVHRHHPQPCPAGGIGRRGRLKTGCLHGVPVRVRGGAPDAVVPRARHRNRAGHVRRGTINASRRQDSAPISARGLGSDTVSSDETTGATPETNDSDASQLDLQMPEASSETSTTPGKGRRVVVAEDEALIRLDVVETLTDAGFEVVGEAGDGQKAIELATELDPDVVVMDVKMPELDGITAAERITKDRIAPVVLLTAFSQTELVERARDAGAMAYVVKPFTPADLLPALEIALSRHQEISALESEVADMADRFETRKRVDRAKGLLMTKMGLTEPEAFRWIQKTSMDRRLTMREVADAVIDQVGSK